MKYELYQKSVQTPEVDVRYIDLFYDEEYGKSPKVLREDFCGTAALSCKWVLSDDERIAFGVDIDKEPLLWCLKNNLSEFDDDQRERLKLIRADVRKVSKKCDVVNAGNFSFCCFKEREVLKDYFLNVKSAFSDEGMLIMDVMGGPYLCRDRIVQKKKIEDFVYIWEQTDFNQIDNTCSCRIHYKLSDGRFLKDAFTYPFRLWSLSELMDLLLEVGFSSSRFMMETPDGEFEVVEKIPNDFELWMGYLIAFN